jgi:hypothetical protein
MALFDNNPLYNNISSLANPVTSGLGNLFDGMSVFGTSIPSGILDTAQEEKLRKQSLLQGLLGTAATYLATPKNLNTGSALPYLGKAFLGGMGASQDVIDRGLNNAYRQKLLAGKEDNIRTYEKDRQKITEQYDPTTKTWTQLGTSSLDAPVTEKPEGFTDTYKNVAIELFGTANPSQLTEQQRKQLGEEIKARAIANKPETKIVMPAGQTKYEETLGKIRAEQDVELVNTAKKSENNISKIDMTLNQIQKSDAITGFGADIQKNVNRFKAKVLNDAKAGKQVADTEILDAFLGSDVFPQIGALGIGAKGLDTPAEREFLRQVMTGTISMDKNALIRMTQIRRDIEKRAIDRYNQSLQSGELDDYFKSTKREKKLINIPDSSGFRIVP